MAENRRFRIEPLEERLALAAQPIISEFMASNGSTLLDGNGSASDWIEIYNHGDEAVDLAGYALTDDPLDMQKWTFPSVSLGPDEYLLVFASGDGVADLAGNLHANFSLSAGGEYLALTDPGGVVLSQFGTSTEDYPPQTNDVSYGLAYNSANLEAVGPDSVSRYLVPTNNSVDAIWTAPAFDDSSWTSGTASLGYETSGSDYASLIQTSVPPGSVSVYVRIDFSVAEAGTLLDTLQMKYDDGFIAYLNGAEIASSFAPAVAAYNSTATSQRSDAVSKQYVDFDVAGFSSLLEVGANTLAIHMLNVNSGSSDFLAVPRLTLATGSLVEPLVEGFTVSPTPGGPNTNLQANPVEFSRIGGAFSTAFQLTLTSADPNETIRYTTDGSFPQANSNLYTNPITISSSTHIRARAFGAVGQVGVVSSEA
ncbi:MAG: chitobiase/beta-hexosaminidase C-terminal domain-containing protein, partial [Planctomycetales bacterium]|nr:chitobiase/beta-hexosaminidase C-terminal domain-containing protein [Planctomycetales bacterium]